MVRVIDLAAHESEHHHLVPTPTVHDHHAAVTMQLILTAPLDHAVVHLHAEMTTADAHLLLPDIVNATLETAIEGDRVHHHQEEKICLEMISLEESQCARQETTGMIEVIRMIESM